MAIRFYDKEVFVAVEGETNRTDLLGFFLKGHMTDLVCVNDDAGKFLGMIDYKGILLNGDLRAALQKEYVVFSENLWRDARQCFLSNDKIKFLPVLNREMNLESFCYQDAALDSIVVKLWKLENLNKFMLPEECLNRDTDCVHIYGMNEASYHLYRLLERHRIPVVLFGEKWDCFPELLKSNEKSRQRYADRNSMIVHSEGEDENSQGVLSWMELCLNDVSEEFGLAEKLFACNFGKTKGNGWQDFRQRSYDSREQVILCTNGRQAEGVYQEFLEQGKEITAFAAETARLWQAIGEQAVFNGKPVYHFSQAVLECRDAIFVISMENQMENENFAAKICYLIGEESNGRVFTYKRNKTGFGGIGKILEKRNVVLAGNPLVCEKAGKYIKEQCSSQTDLYYYPVADGELPNLPYIRRYSREDDKCPKETTVYLAGIPWGASGGDRYGIQQQSSQWIDKLHEAGFWDISTYFSFEPDIWERDLERRNRKEEINADSKRLRTKDIFGLTIGYIGGHCGNVFVRELLDGHPEILSLPIGEFEAKAWFFACLAEGMESGEEAAKRVQALYHAECETCVFQDAEEEECFFRELSRTLQQEEVLSAGSIFKAVYIAYFYLTGRKHCPGNTYIIYFEPHKLKQKEIIGAIYHWGKQNFKKAVILSSVREPVKKLGSIIREKHKNNNGFMDFAAINGGGSFAWPEGCGKEDSCIFRFEDLKRFPKQVLAYLCDKMEISWSDSLLSTTVNGKPHSYFNGVQMISDFDLTPVYNQYGEYFSSFDWFRLDILFHPNRKYFGYSESDISQFSRKQILEWMKQPFLFETDVLLCGRENFLEFRKRLYENIKYDINMQEREDEFREYFQFQEYFHVKQE